MSALAERNAWLTRTRPPVRVERPKVSPKVRAGYRYFGASIEAEEELRLGQLALEQTPASDDLNIFGSDAMIPVVHAGARVAAWLQNQMTVVGPLYPSIPVQIISHHHLASEIASHVKLLHPHVMSILRHTDIMVSLITMDDILASRTGLLLGAPAAPAIEGPASDVAGWERALRELYEMVGAEPETGCVVPHLDTVKQVEKVIGAIRPSKLPDFSIDESDGEVTLMWERPGNPAFVSLVFRGDGNVRIISRNSDRTPIHALVADVKADKEILAALRHADLAWLVFGE